MQVGKEILNRNKFRYCSKFTSSLTKKYELGHKETCLENLISLLEFKYIFRLAKIKEKNYHTFIIHRFQPSRQDKMSSLFHF